MRPARLLILILAAALVAGCARRPPVARAPAPLPVSALDAYAIGAAIPPPGPPIGGPVVPVPTVLPSDGPYLLDAGDRLRVVVFGQDGLSNSYSVDVGGNITLPLIGMVPARGATTAELSRAIAGRLRQGYIREPHVAVEVEAYRPFFILGEVTYPGQYPYVANMTVETAVAIAGGFSPRAYRQTAVVSRSAGGQVYRAKVPLDVAVRPGDTISVTERWF